VGLCRTVIMTIAHLMHGVRAVVDALLRPRRFHSRSSRWLYPALCTLASSLVIAPIAGLGPVAWAANEPLPPSVLILDQSSADSPWYADFSANFRSTLNAGSERRFSVYSEHLDLSRFPGTQHHEVLRTYLQNKYRDRPIGVLVVQGSSSLEFLMRSRAQLWPGVPVVFAGVDKETADRLNLPPDVTGTIRQLVFRNAVTTAQALVPNLKRIALVGDPWERQAVRKHYKDEIAALANQFEFIDLLGLPMTEIRKRVAVLPENTAIIHTAINVDGAGVAYIPREALAAVAEVANRPIVIDVETSVGYGSTGGLVSRPHLIGQQTAQIVLRIFNGERPSEIPITVGDFLNPVFDWRQLQRFGISESRLPPGSEVRFREFGLWEQYRWQMVAICFALLLQAALIGWLLLEHHRRRIVEMKLRARLLEVIHLNRTATAGALSASVAHELNQPLGAIQSYAEAATLYLKADPPDIERAERILANIRRDNQRAADIISHLRGLLKKRDETDLQEFDLNEAVRDALQILRPEALKRGVALDAHEANSPLPVRADPIHLQQVILNLAVNGMDAMQDCAPGGGKISIQTTLADESAIEVRVADSGMGIPADKLNTIFDAFYTTKRDGTGLGLSIARAIIETHGGKIWAENRPGGGAVFRFTLPLSRMLAA
jgi:signal transduction histidine kinase